MLFGVGEELEAARPMGKALTGLALSVPW